MISPGRTTHMAAPPRLVFGLLLLMFPIITHGFPASLVLERVRHEKIFSSSSSSSRVPIELPVNGSFTQMFYYTRIWLGSPPREYYLLIDTGSDIVWVSCSCQGCPKSDSSSHFFDPRTSSTASVIGCDDQRCPSEDASKETYCSHNDECRFAIEYGDHSNSSGYYVSDLLHLPSDSGTTNFTSEIVFGCSTESEDSTVIPYESIDGILGLGPTSVALTSQLASRGVAPGAFSHCLRGGDVGGGQLVLGAAMVPGMNYTPIVSRLHYSVIMRSITVNDRQLTINPSVFAKSETIVDSGTAMAYMIDDVYDPLMQEVTAAVTQVAHSYIAPDQEQCYSTSSSIDVFPRIRMDFDGGAFLWLSPQDYVQQKNSTLWCLGFRRTNIPGVTILGELVLRDKIIVYDLEAQRIGWVKYNCSTPFEVSTADSVNTGNENANSCLLNFLLCVIVFVTLWL